MDIDNKEKVQTKNSHSNSLRLTDGSTIFGINLMKLLMFISLIGIGLFLLQSIALILTGIFHNRIIVTTNYLKIIHPYALVEGIYFGISLWLPYVVLELSNCRISRRRLVNNLKMGWKYHILIIFSALFIGLMAYLSLIQLTSIYLHNNAEKVYVSIIVTPDSIWSNRKALRSDCRYSLDFTALEFSSASKSICISQNESSYLSKKDHPKIVELYGYKSFYGYDLHCCH